jgi:hypothetical protein
LIAVLLPITDAVLGRVYLSRLCAREGGLAIKRVVAADGFRVRHPVFDDRDSDEGLRRWIEQHGVTFLEGQYKRDGTVDRVSIKGGSVVRERDVAPLSDIEYDFRGADVRELFPRDVKMLRNIRTGEVLATYTQIGFTGGWVERLLGSLSDAGPQPSWCRGPTGVEGRTELVKRAIGK